MNHDHELCIGTVCDESNYEVSDTYTSPRDSK